MVGAGSCAGSDVPQVGAEEWRLGILGVDGVFHSDAGSGDCERPFSSHCLGSLEEMENLPGYLDCPGPLYGLFLQSVGFDLRIGRDAHFQ